MTSHLIHSHLGLDIERLFKFSAKRCGDIFNAKYLVDVSAQEIIYMYMLYQIQGVLRSTCIITSTDGAVYLSGSHILFLF